MNISRKAQEAFKTALAMTIAYGISLYLNWDQTVWAGIAVAMVSLATMGQSFNKAALRMIGTLFGAIVALFFIAQFPQERWLFMIALSAWVAFCTYMMLGSDNPYFWHVSGFVCAIICMGGGPDPVNAFDTAMLRTQQTGLGILVYSLVVLFVWPNSSGKAFLSVTESLSSLHQKLFQTHFSIMTNTQPVEESRQSLQELKQKEFPVLNQFQQLFLAARNDSSDIAQNQKLWNQYQVKVNQYVKTLDVWHENISDIQLLDLFKLIPGLNEYYNNINKKYTQIGQLLKGEKIDKTIETCELEVHDDAFEQLSHFEKTALIVNITQLKRIDQISMELVNLLSMITGQTAYKNTSDSLTLPSKYSKLFQPDIDRFSAVIRVMASLWIAFLSLIYINDLPGGVTNISILVPFAMVFATTPQLPVAKLLIPVLGSIAFACLIYIFLLPHMSSFLSLGPLLFVVTFIICYLYALPQQVLNRAFGLVLFLAITGISNDQVYSFYAMSTTSLTFAIIFLILAITAYIPFSPQPDKVFLRLLKRFFRSTHIFISLTALNQKKSLTWHQNYLKQFHKLQLMSIPAKLNAWSRFINPELLIGSNKGLLPIIANLQAISNRVQEIHVVASEAHHSEDLNVIIQELQEWHAKLQIAFTDLAQDPTISDSEYFQNRLAEIMSTLENRIKALFNKSNVQNYKTFEANSFYHLLGTYRGLSEALVGYSKSTDSIDWSRWKEQRF